MIRPHRFTYEERMDMTVEELEFHLQEIDKKDSSLFEEQKSLRYYGDGTRKVYDLKKQIEEERKILNE